MEYILSSDENESVFDILSENHDYYLDTSDVINLNQNSEHTELNIIELLNEDHDIYLDNSDIYSNCTYRQKSCINLQQDTNRTNSQKTITPEEHLQYLTFIQTEYERRNSAAFKIQKCWRRFYDKRTYKKIKKLLYKYMETDPMEVLRTVNPKEAGLLDRASGSYVKFRLAGLSFPPKIVYKIYSRRPVVKINSVLNLKIEDTWIKPKKHVSNKNKQTDELFKFISNKFENTEPNEIIEKYSEINEKNDWRPYSSYKYLSKTKNEIRKSKAKIRPKSNNRKRIEMSWIKSQYAN